jgi:hypothetical protein
MTADYDRAVADHIIDVWQKCGELLALIEVVPTSDYLLIENVAVRPDQQVGPQTAGELRMNCERLHPFDAAHGSQPRRALSGVGPFSGLDSRAGRSIRAHGGAA